ncbi:MAG: hypothetical protein R2849_00875 [Thermomicrobiales bacterium]
MSGPFTVERRRTASSRLTTSVRVRRPRASDADAQGGGFVPMILDNLRKAGVQNTVRDERLTFDRLDTFPGQWLQGGEYTNKTGRSSGCRRDRRSMARSGGDGQEAAKEAMRGAGFDLLVVCGFAFDAHAETGRVPPEPNGSANSASSPRRPAEYGKPRSCRADEPRSCDGRGLLKTTVNLFMVFGEPDLEITEQEDGKLVEARRRRLRPDSRSDPSNSTDDIAAGSSTPTTTRGCPPRLLHRRRRAVRPSQARPPGPRSKDAWSQLYSATSRPSIPLDGQDRGESHQSLRRRGAEGVPGVGRQ